MAATAAKPTLKRTRTILRAKARRLAGRPPGCFSVLASDFFIPI
jgi:hypothetical protein